MRWRVEAGEVIWEDGSRRPVISGGGDSGGDSPSTTAPVSSKAPRMLPPANRYSQYYSALAGLPGRYTQERSLYGSGAAPAMIGTRHPGSANVTMTPASLLLSLLGGKV